MLGDLATTQQNRVSEYRLRKTRYDQRTFRKDEAEYARTEGWELVRENQNTDRYQKLKSTPEQLENEFWCLLYSLGYTTLNVGRTFQIEITSTTKVSLSKQIDVFAYDAETIIVAECKSCEKRTKRHLQKDIGEFTANQKPISNTLRKFFGGKFDQKIIWLFVTRNIEWLENDRARAEEANIEIITERELYYYKEIAKRIGPSARFQFHAEFLANSKVNALERKVFALRSRLGSHKAYTFFAPARTILPITFVNHRDLRDPNAAPSYQRLIHRQRLRDIASFLKGGGFFPNSVILNFKRKIRFDILKPEDNSGIAAGELTLPNTYKSAWIIDGQHRLYGYNELEDEEHISHIPILAFENIDISEETKIFADINSKQKNVSKKLLDEITGEIKLEATDKREQVRAIASRSFDLLRDDEDGPLGDKIAGAELKRGDDSVMTIPYLVDATIQSGLLGRVTVEAGNTAYLQGFLSWSDPREAITSLRELLSEYFELFRIANEERWNSGKSGKFASNVGAAGLIRLLGDLIAYLANKEHEEPRELHPKIIIERIEKYLAPCTAYFRNALDTDVDHRFQVPFGSGGPRVFQHRLRELVHQTFEDFNPKGFEDDLRKYDARRRQEADQLVRAIVEGVHRRVIKLIEQLHGPSDEGLKKAVDNKEILKKAFEKQLDDQDRKDLGTYLEFIDLRKIVEVPKNWDAFKPDFHIQLPGEQSGRAKYVSWFDEINKLRRISAHPYNRGYSDEEIERIKTVHTALLQRGIVANG